MGVTYDFGGWATKNDLLCSDGRTIRKDAFKDNDGQTVPLVWNHDHNSPENVLGHALLENREEGVYAYCSLNETSAGNIAKALVQHGDISALSIYANRLKQQGGNVIHGAIREVSLVLAGANPGAEIVDIMQHGEFVDDAAVIYSEDQVFEAGVHEVEHSEERAVEPEAVIEHAEEKTNEEAPSKSEKTVKEVLNELTEKQRRALYFVISQILDGGEPAMQHADSEEKSEDAPTGDETVQDVLNTITDPEQQMLVAALIEAAIKESKGSENTEAKKPEENKDEKSEGDDVMKHNVFENEVREENVISHAEMMSAIADAKRMGSMKESFIQHGIEDIEYLFPEARNMNVPPEFVDRDQAWVTKVMNGTTHTPFSRIKSMFADITEDDARALGYLADHTHRDAKGNLVDSDGNPVFKKEEVFSLLKRSTTPTTIYKKQKLDRDDVVDITDFDVVAWIKREMRGKLDEEVARAILIGDGRLSSSDDKINEQNIRPIVSDSSFFTIKTKITTPTTVTEDEKAKAIIRAAVKSRNKYKGSGNPVFFTTEEYLTNLLLLEDGVGHRLYKTESELAAAMRVSGIVTVPVMENYKNAAGQTVDLIGIIVNLKDYTVGADKGGAVNMFDDFDIDYNAQKYLIETRCSGALTKPYSAIAMTAETSSSVTDCTITITTSATI